jgi:hypothetical protein
VGADGYCYCYYLGGDLDLGREEDEPALVDNLYLVAVIRRSASDECFRELLFYSHLSAFS